MFQFIFKNFRYNFSLNFYRRNCIRQLYILLCTLFFVQFGYSATKTWNGGTGGGKNWNTNSNWNPSGAPVAGDDVIFNTAGTITFTTTPTGDRAFNSLTISQGTIVIGGTTRLFTLGGNTGVDFTIANGATLTTTNLNITLASNATATIAGTYNNSTGRTYNTNGTNVVSTVTGTIINYGTVTCATASKLLFNSGSTYQHALNGGSIPTATWDTNSSCLITGITNTVPTTSTFFQSFGNFNWNCTSQNSLISLSASMLAVKGNFTITSTGTSQLALSTGTSSAFTVTGNFNMIAGTLNFNSGANQSAINLRGNYTQSGGTITESGLGSGLFIFDGSTMQTFTRTAGTVSNTISYRVVSGSYLQMASESTTIIGAGNFELNTGATLGITSANGITTTGATGNIQVTGTRTYSANANYIYNRTDGTQVTGNGLLSLMPNNVTISNTSGVTLSGDRTIGGSLTLNEGALFNMSTYSLNRNTTGGGSVVLNNNSTLTVSGASNFPANFLTYSLANSSTVNYDYASGSQSISGQTYGNLTVSGGTKNLTGATIVNGNLSLTSSLLTLGSYDLTLGATTNVLGTPGVAKMIVATGTGTLRKYFTSATSFVFPVGDNTGTAEYTPLNIVFSGGTFASGALVAVKLTDDKHPNVSGTSNYVSRYWTVSQTGITNFSATVTGTIVTADLEGFTPSNIITSRYNSNNQEWTDHDAVTGTSISATAITAFGDFTGRNNVPTIVSSSISLTGFTYAYGLGPSSIQSFNVGGSGLNTNIEVLPTDSFEISSLGGVSFTAMPLVRLNVLNREVQSTPVYVRLKAGLPVKASIVNNLSCISTNATTVNVSCSGSVTAAPQIEITPDTLTGFTYNLGSITSPYQSVVVTGSNLTANIVVTAPTNYEMSTTSTGTYQSSLTINQSGGSVNTTLYIRLKVGLAAAIYNESFTFSSTNAASVSLYCKGEVKRASISVSKLSLAGFIYSVDNGPSSIQTFTVGGSTLSGDISVTPPTNFEISTNGTDFYSSAIGITPTSGSVSATTVYVRLKSGLAIGTYANENITLSATGAISQTVKCSGQVSASVATISSVNTLNGFFYLFGKGPSVTQNFTVSGTSLTGPIIITAPTNFELSTNGTTFGSFLTIPSSGGVVNASPVYVRLKSGLSVGTYTSESIVMSSAGADDVTIVANGKVLTTPTIEAGPAGLDSICTSTSVTLTSTGTNISSQSWTGPNGFTSTDQNPSLGTVTNANNGNYIVTGNVLSGVNLLTNGDFELGNQDFGSTYTYRTTGGTSNPYGTYWIMASPSSANSSYFRNTTDHSSSGTLQMIIDGAETAGAIIWSQTVAVNPNSDYIFEYYGQNVSITDVTNVGRLQLYVNNVPVGPVNVLSAQSWVGFNASFNSSSSTSVQLTLINSHIGGAGNDFAIDDLNLQQILTVKDTVSLNVLPTLTPSVTVTASENPAYSGTVVTFTANVVNAGPSYSYQWQVGGSNVDGANSQTFDYTPTNGQQITCVVTSQYNCLTVNPVSDTETMEVRDRTNYWYGGVSTDWGTPANWTQGFVPLAGNDVVFATAANNNENPAQRDLVLDTNRTIGNLINATNLSVIIPAGKTLIVNNNITQTSGLDNLLQIQASTTLANGSIIYNNSLSSTVRGTVQMFSPASWDLTKPVNQKYNWQYFGIPVTSVSALPTFYGAYVRELIESDPDTATHWRSLTNESVLVPFKGYELCQKNANTLYTFNGTLINSDYNTGQLAKTATGLYPGQHLLANPYTCAINVKFIEFGTDMEQTVYLYSTGTFNSWKTNPDKSDLGEGITPGQYNAIPKAQAGTGGLLTQVPSMGTFMVRLLTAKTSSPQSYVALDYSTVAMANTERQRVISNAAVEAQTQTIINVEGEYGADKVWLMSHDNYSNSFDNGYDGFKLTGSAMNPQLYAVQDGNKYQINSIPDINNTVLYFQAGVDTDYTLKINHDNATLQKYNKIFLHDLYTGKIIDISQPENEYQFRAVTSPTAKIRFRILTSLNQNTNKQQQLSSSYVYENTLFVQNLTEKEGRVFVFDITGKLLKASTFSAYENVNVHLAAKQAYIVKRVIGNVTEVSKLIIQ